MRRMILAGLALVWAGCAGAQDVPPGAGPGEMLLEIPGYMAPVGDTACIPLSDAAPGLSPADLALALARCLQDGAFANAADLYVLIGVRSEFDRRRVLDTTGHDADRLLQQIVAAHMNPDQRAGFRTALGALGGAGSDWHTGFCAAMRAQGAPGHDPSYMVFHGKGDLIAKNAPTLADPFDAAAVWDDVLAGWMQCAS